MKFKEALRIGIIVTFVLLLIFFPLICAYIFRGEFDRMAWAGWAVWCAVLRWYVRDKKSPDDENGEESDGEEAGEE